MAVAAPIIAAGIAAGTAVYSSEQQHRAAKKARADQESDRIKQEEALAEQEREKTSQEQRDLDLQRKRSRAANAGGRASTILTTPLGVSDAPQSSNKTLLGT